MMGDVGDIRGMIKIRQAGRRTVPRDWLPLDRVSFTGLDSAGRLDMHVWGDAGPSSPRDGCVSVPLDREDAERLFTHLAIRLGHLDLVKDRRIP